MFERYTEKARRVIFYARYEASEFGSSAIEAEHLLLGLLREEGCFAAKILRDHGAEPSRIRVALANPPQQT
jgi:ATP-dependent Clp protease ATP-binding subunit ClpC